MFRFVYLTNILTFSLPYDTFLTKGNDENRFFLNVVNSATLEIKMHFYKTSFIFTLAP